LTEGFAMRNGLLVLCLIFLAAIAITHVLPGLFGILGSLILAPFAVVGALILVAVILLLVFSGIGAVGAGVLGLAGLILLAVFLPILIPLLIFIAPVVILLKLIRKA
jgi:hypothetical protein